MMIPSVEKSRQLARHGTVRNDPSSNPACSDFLFLFFVFFSEHLLKTFQINVLIQKLHLIHRILSILTN